jgi:hypothetical protein
VKLKHANIKSDDPLIHVQLIAQLN